jgi:hypothetical protein
MLLVKPTPWSIELITYDASTVVDLISLDSEAIDLPVNTVSRNERRVGSIEESRVKQDPEYSPIAFVQVIRDEPIELEDSQFFVKRLLEKRVRRVRRRKVVQHSGDSTIRIQIRKAA